MPKAKTNKISIPFPFRYKGKNSCMHTVENDSGGFCQYPKSRFAVSKVRPNQVAIIKSPCYKDLQKGKKQMLSQTSKLAIRKVRTNQVAIIKSSRYKDLQKGGKRIQSQTSIMENTSPNKIAVDLELPFGSWEWLHLVAFSLKPTHVSELSNVSRKAIMRTKQPQQIKENLVLGTAEANTAMLTYETFIKKLMEANPTLTLDLFVNATIDSCTIKNKTDPIPVATNIEYHFQFKTSDGKITSPCILSFNPQDHTAPSISEFNTSTKLLEDFPSKNTITIPKGFKGLSIAKMEPLNF